MKELFEHELGDVVEDCPCHSNGKCTNKPTYNGHVNDLRYGDCCTRSCPFIYWVNKLVEKNND